MLVRRGTKLISVLFRKAELEKKVTLSTNKLHSVHELVPISRFYESRFKIPSKINYSVQNVLKYDSSR